MGDEKQQEPRRVSPGPVTLQWFFEVQPKKSGLLDFSHASRQILNSWIFSHCSQPTVCPDGRIVVLDFLGISFSRSDV